MCCSESSQEFAVFGGRDDTRDKSEKTLRFQANQLSMHCGRHAGSHMALRHFDRQRYLQDRSNSYRNGYRNVSQRQAADESLAANVPSLFVSNVAKLQKRERRRFAEDTVWARASSFAAGFCCSLHGHSIDKGMSLWASPDQKSWPTDSRHIRIVSSSTDNHPHHSIWPRKRAQRSSPREWSRTIAAMDQLADCSCPPSVRRARKPILERARNPKSGPTSMQAESYNTSGVG